MKRLIVDADDLGLTTSINRGIAKAVCEGIVTSVEVLPTGEAFDDAVSTARTLKCESVGVHCALTETVPVAGAHAVPTLVDSAGRFYKSHSAFLARFFVGLVSRDEIYREWRAQLERVRQAGLTITNISTHEHVHLIPELLAILVRLAREYRIPSIRCPRSERVFRRFGIAGIYRWLILTHLGRHASRILESASVYHADHFLGFLGSGNLQEETLLEMIATLEEGTTELVCHPGFLGPEILDHFSWHRNCEHELHALTSPRVIQAIRDNNVTLISYRDFVSS